MFVGALTVGRCVPSIFSHGSSRIGYIDGLRGYLALAVIGSHFQYASHFAASAKWEAPNQFVFSSLGAIAVSCFFMITGMLFYRRAVLDDRAVDWSQLYRGRIFRLYPAYILAALCVIVIASYMSGRVPSFERQNILALVSWSTFTLPGPRKVNEYIGTGYIVAGVTWTLCYEWAFYLALPMVRTFLKPLNSAPARVLLLAGLVVASYTLRPVTVWYFESRIATIFLFGMLTAEIISQSRGVYLLAGRMGSALGLAALLASFCFENYSGLQAGAIFVFFLTVALGNSCWGCLARREAVILGDASYSIYLFHGVVLFLLTQTLIKDGLVELTVVHWALLPLAGALTAALSIVIFKTVERPFMEMGRTAKTKSAVRVST